MSKKFKKIKPFTLPNMKVAPLRGREEFFRLSDNDKHMFDHFATESSNSYGTQIDFFSQNKNKAKMDPVYNEPIERSWVGPYRLFAWVSWADSTPIVGDDGFKFRWQSMCWIPRKSLEEVGAPAPFEGDVIRYWNIPFFNESGGGGQNLASAGYFFDVINADDDGHVVDEAHFVGFKCDLVRRSEFGAERRIISPQC